MCVTAQISGTTVETVGELRQYCPTIVFLKIYTQPTPDDGCLCGVDFEATALANGFVASSDVWGDWTLHPAEGS